MAPATGSRSRSRPATSTTFRDPAVILVDQLNKIHFDAELDVVESSVWYNRLFKKDYSVALNLAGAGIDDPDGVLKMGFACKSEANFSQYCNPEVDKLLDQQSQEPDLAKRKATVVEDRTHPGRGRRTADHLPRHRGDVLASPFQGPRPT